MGIISTLDVHTYTIVGWLTYQHKNLYMNRKRKNTGSAAVFAKTGLYPMLVFHNPTKLLLHRLLRLHRFMEAPHVLWWLEKAVKSCSQCPRTIGPPVFLVLSPGVRNLLHRAVVGACSGEMQTENVLILWHCSDLLPACNSADAMLMHTPCGELVLAIFSEVSMRSIMNWQLCLARIEMAEECAECSS